MSTEDVKANVEATVNANSDAIEAWNTVLFDKFVRFRHLMTTGLADHGRAAFAIHSIAAGSKAVDLGCGFGDSTQEIAKIVGDNGEAIGIDAAKRFVEASEADAHEAGIRNVRFRVADVQSDSLGGPYDFAFSRFGMMFFASPVQALRNIRRSLKAGGKLCMVVWRKREDNAFIHLAEKAVRAIIPEPEKRDAPTCGPGPFSMAGADAVTDMLLAAGYDLPTLTRSDRSILIGRDLEEAIEFAMALGPAGEILRLAGEDGERKRPQVVKALREALTPHVSPRGVEAMSSAWIVSATS